MQASYKLARLREKIVSHLVALDELLESIEDVRSDVVNLEKEKEKQSIEAQQERFDRAMPVRKGKPEAIEGVSIE